MKWPNRKRNQQSLTQRQQQVYNLLLQGKCDKEIAAALGVSHPTVRFHVAAILRLLQASGRIELLARRLAS